MDSRSWTDHQVPGPDGHGAYPSYRASRPVIPGNKILASPVLRTMTEISQPARLRFEREVLPHLDAAYNLARWLTRDPDDAEDVVQDACMRALRYVGTLRSGGAKAWFLTVVRNACLRLGPRAIGRWNSSRRTDSDAIDDAIPHLEARGPEQEAMRGAEARVLADAARRRCRCRFREARRAARAGRAFVSGEMASVDRRSRGDRDVATRARTRDAAPNAVVATPSRTSWKRAGNP